MNTRLTLTALLFAGATCGRASSLPVARPGELRLTITGDPKTFDPLQVTEEYSEIVRYLIGATLVRIDHVTDQVRPELAESERSSSASRRRRKPVIYLVNPDFLKAIAPSVHGFNSAALFPQSLSTVESLSLQ